MTPKEEMEARIKEDGFDPENFTCRYVEEAVPDLPLDSSRPGDAEYRFKDLPEDLDSFSCVGENGKPVYQYNKYGMDKVKPTFLISTSDPSSLDLQVMNDYHNPNIAASVFPHISAGKGSASWIMKVLSKNPIV